MFARRCFAYGEAYQALAGAADDGARQGQPFTQSARVFRKWSESAPQMGGPLRGSDLKVLLTKIRALGDTVLLTSSVEFLKKKFPEMRITLIVPAAFVEIFQGNPNIQNVWAMEETGVLRGIFRLRREKFDLALFLHASPRQKWWQYFGGAQRAVYHDQHAETEALYGCHPNALEWDAHLFERVFSLTERPTLPTPKVFLSEDEKKWGENYWRQRGADPKKVIFLGLGASRSTKRWPADYFARLAELCRERNDWIPAIVPGPGAGDAEFSGRVVDELRAKGFRPTAKIEKNTHFLFESGLSIRQLAALLSAVKFYVGNDSGPKHLAVAVGTKTFTFFGPEDPVEWHPYSRDEHPLFFLPNLECRREDHGRWCSLTECTVATVEKHRCMRGLDPLEVFQSVTKAVL